jgi:hypothetical protein
MWRLWRKKLLALIPAFSPRRRGRRNLSCAQRNGTFDRIYRINRIREKGAETKSRKTRIFNRRDRIGHRERTKTKTGNFNREIREIRENRKDGKGSRGDAEGKGNYEG